MPVIILFVFSLVLFSDTFFKTLYSANDLWVNLLEFLPDAFSPTTNLMESPIMQVVIAIIILGIGVSVYVYARLDDRWWFVLVSGIWCLLIVFPTFNEIRLRNEIGMHTHGHDGGVIQTLESLKVLYRGENPYSADFSDTPMKQWGDPHSWVDIGYPEGNPALTHIPYSPLQFLIHVPFDVVSSFLNVTYDPRLLYLIAIVLTAILSTYITKNRDLKLTTFTLVLFNPLVPQLTGYGMNDGVVVLFLLIMLLGLIKGKRIVSVLALALAISLKIICVFFVPFVFLLFLFQDIQEIHLDALRKWIVSQMKLIGVFIGILIMVYGPFIIWNAGNLYDDVIAFNNGTSAISYPIRGDGGYGFGTFVLYFGLVDSVKDYFPFWIVQLAVAVVIGGVFVQKLKKEPTAIIAITGGLLLLSAELYVSRFWHKNYFIYPLVLGWFAYVIGQKNFWNQKTSEVHSP